jgi:hypothetical protein
MYHDPYAHLYQKSDGFKIQIYENLDKTIEAYLSLEPSTRSTYDIAMRDATINGLVTSDDIDKIKASQIFYKGNKKEELYIIQSVNELEFQKNTRNITAIKQNSFVTIQRKKYNEETDKEEYVDIYTNVISFVSMQNKDEKNFAAGIEDNTNINIQIPKRDFENSLRIVENEDRILLSDISKEMTRKIKAESIDAFGVPGVIRIYGTYDTRTGE